MIEFGTPRYGWLTIKITDDRNPRKKRYVRVSYLTDVPIDLLQSTIISLKTGLPFSVDFDGEDKGCFLLTNSTYIGDLVVIGENRTFRTSSINDLDFAKIILKHIEDNINEYYDWGIISEDNKEEKEIYKEKINSLVKKLKEEIKKRED